MSISRKVNMIELQDWDDLIEKTYGKPYSLQQQDGCKLRGIESIEVPATDSEYFEKETIPFELNGDEMGVKFSAWLAADPKSFGPDNWWDWERELFWHRNFYPDLSVLADDLYKKGLLEAGEYYIDIDW